MVQDGPYIYLGQDKTGTERSQRFDMKLGKSEAETRMNNKNDGQEVGM